MAWLWITIWKITQVISVGKTLFLFWSVKPCSLSRHPRTLHWRRLWDSNSRGETPMDESTLGPWRRNIFCGWCRSWAVCGGRQTSSEMKTEWESSTEGISQINYPGHYTLVSLWDIYHSGGLGFLEQFIDSIFTRNVYFKFLPVLWFLLGNYRFACLLEFSPSTIKFTNIGPSRVCLKQESVSANRTN